MTYSILFAAFLIIQTVLSSDSPWILKTDEFSGSVNCNGSGTGVLKCITSAPVEDGPNAGLFKNGLLYNEQLPTGLSTLKFTIVEGSAIDLGITDTKKFDKDALGLFYEGRGRLSDGQNGIIYTITQKGIFERRGIMVDEYGPALQAGDEVLLTSNISAQSIQIYFTVNGVPLGKAFEVPRDALEEKIFPVVKVPVSADSTVNLEFVKDSLPILIRAPQKRLEPLDGRWTYLSGTIDNPLNRNIVLKFTKPADTDDILNASIDVINTLSFRLRKADKEGKRWIFSTGMTSLVGGPPEDMRLESELSNFFWGQELSFAEEGDDILITKNSGAGELKWKRLILTPEVITSNPFLD